MTLGGSFSFNIYVFLAVILCLILIGLIVSIMFQGRILNAIYRMNEEKPKEHGISYNQEIQRENIPLSQKEQGKGQVKIVDVEDDEVIAAIIAAVSHVSNMKLSSINIKSIKRVKAVRQ